MRCQPLPQKPITQDKGKEGKKRLNHDFFHSSSGEGKGKKGKKKEKFTGRTRAARVSSCELHSPSGKIRRGEGKNERTRRSQSRICPRTRTDSGRRHITQSPVSHRKSQNVDRKKKGGKEKRRPEGPALLQFAGRYIRFSGTGGVRRSRGYGLTLDSAAPKKERRKKAVPRGHGGEGTLAGRPANSRRTHVMKRKFKNRGKVGGGKGEGGKRQRGRVKSSLYPDKPKTQARSNNLYSKGPNCALTRGRKERGGENWVPRSRSQGKTKDQF